ncbi:MAG: hypothetical protein U1E63_02040 [Burkholderiales bacterium]
MPLAVRFNKAIPEVHTLDLDEWSRLLELLSAYWQRPASARGPDVFHVEIERAPRH